MKTLYVANTAFEWELEKGTCSLDEVLSSHINCKQLQYLPLILKRDALVTHALGEQCVTLDSTRLKEYDKVVSWGASQAVKKWAKEHGLIYDTPPLDVVKKLASKAFIVPFSRETSLVSSRDELHNWIDIHPGKYVIKQCLNCASRGHVFNIEKAVFPSVVEIWKNRVFDFSTQWNLSITGDISYIGATVCINSKKGVPLGNLAGDEKEIFGTYYPFLQEHIKEAQPLLEECIRTGYYGPIGIDAFLYQEEDVQLRAICEVNIRETMGLMALNIYQQMGSKNPITLSYEKKKEHGILPYFIPGSVHSFPRNLFVK